MSLLQLIVQPAPNVTHFDTRVVLDRVPFKLSFYTNGVDRLWYMDLETDDGQSAVRGIGLASGVDLLYPYRYLDLPPGPLWVHDQGLAGEDPDLAAFADGRAALYYLEQGG